MPDSSVVVDGAAISYGDVPISHARRLADAFPHATLQPIPDSSTYVMLDQPDETAGAIAKFLNNN
jgi:pimeloyl-ACP methyl ester carboxylesterase